MTMLVPDFFSGRFDYRFMLSNHLKLSNTGIWEHVGDAQSFKVINVYLSVLEMSETGE